ncbi:uncharacterized protein LOC122246381 [Penaeus japonicus]|uniref:uncharacterized protein LOC122246381 n=1 Tax=Penaeus japonicus TaxID=27405 RepID=UPI001C70D8B7|nr:uncharacterized protein LOC122246381 [Penaeus japonicus]
MAQDRKYNNVLLFTVGPPAYHICTEATRRQPRHTAESECSNDGGAASRDCAHMQPLSSTTGKAAVPSESPGVRPPPTTAHTYSNRGLPYFAILCRRVIPLLILFHVLAERCSSVTNASPIQYLAFSLAEVEQRDEKSESNALNIPSSSDKSALCRMYRSFPHPGVEGTRCGNDTPRSDVTMTL